LDTITNPIVQDWSFGLTAIYSEASPIVNSINEDAASVVPAGDRTLVLVVADGMGGSPSGERASKRSVQAIEASLRSAEPHRDARQLAIMKGFDLANKKVQDLGVGAGTTLAVLEVQGSLIRPYHVGDSLILIVGQRGKIKFQSISHSPVGYAVESGMLDEEEAMHHEDRAMVSNIVGSTSMSVDVGPELPLAPRDTVLIASDGLSDNLRLQEIVDRIRVGPLEEVCYSLASYAKKRMSSQTAGVPSKPDDLTFVLYRPQA